MNTADISMETVAFGAGILFLACAALVVTLRWVSRTHPRSPAGSDLRECRLRNQLARSIRKGVGLVDLARVYSQIDLALLGSLLAAAGIPCETLFPLTNNLRMGMAIRGYNDVILRVRYTDLSRASQVVQRYRYKRRGSRIKATTRLRNVIEYLVAGQFANPNSQVPELMISRRSRPARLRRPVER